MADNVYALYKPVYYLSKCLFLAPPSLDGSQPASVLHAIPTAVMAASYLYLTYLSFGDVAGMHPVGNSAIALNMDRAVLGFNAVYILMSLDASRRHRTIISKFLGNFEDFDRTAKRYFGREVRSGGKSRKGIRMYFLHSLLCDLYLLGELWYGVATFGGLQWYNVSYLLGLLIRKIVVCQYITILNFALWRFRFINEIVLGMDGLGGGVLYGNAVVVTLSNSLEGKKLAGVKTKKIRDTLTMLRLLHEGLCNACRELGEKFGVFQVFGILTGLLEELAQAFGVFITISNDEGLSNSYLWLAFLRAAMYMYVVGATHFYFVFYYCDGVQKESVRSGYLVQSLYLTTDCKKDIMDDVKLFSLQLQQSHLVFSAAGVFILDWELMSTITSEVFSYLIFFIQSSGFTFEEE